MSITASLSLRLAPLAIALASVVTPVAGADFVGLVDIGGGRKMYLECSGTGSPTVVLISGKGNGAADWSEVLDPADPAHDADYDAVAWGKGDLHKSESAVFPMVSRFTRVCAYDRPGVRLDGPDQSTPVAQPHPADQAADDLHQLLTAQANPALTCSSPTPTEGWSPRSLRGPGPTKWTVSSWSTPRRRSCARWRARRVGEVGRVQPEVRAGGSRGHHAPRCVRQDRRCCSAARTAGCGALQRQAVATAIRPTGERPGGRHHLRGLASVGEAARDVTQRQVRREDEQRSQHLCLLAAARR